MLTFTSRPGAALCIASRTTSAAMPLPGRSAWTKGAKSEPVRKRIGRVCVAGSAAGSGSLMTAAALATRARGAVPIDGAPSRQGIVNSSPIFNLAGLTRVSRLAAKIRWYSLAP